MLMHYNAQPLVTWKSNQGLLNQLGVLRKAGAMYTQVLMLTPRRVPSGTKTRTRRDWRSPR